jgi:NAD(P)-dependent dehydrogenase (short-subunit alcohol dehydrogenase family)
MGKKMLAGKNILITGASRGLGCHIARAMWQNGANLFLLARSREFLEELRKELVLSALPGQSIYVFSFDLKQSESVVLIAGEVRRVWDRLDGLVNNAGILGPIGQAWETDWEKWQETIFTNLFAPVALCRAFVPWMAENGGGKIINLSGGGATGPRPRFSAYAVSKTGIVRFSEILARETIKLNIQVNCVAPGALSTDMLGAVLKAGPEKAGKKEYDQALKLKESSGATIERATALCVFLASTASDGITGKLISAVWDPWEDLPKHVDDLIETDIYTLRRIVPKERGKEWGYD